MKVVKCDRCGVAIPYRPPYMNVNTSAPTLILSVWHSLQQRLQEVDLCESCKSDVYNFIFDFNKGEAHDKRTVD